MQSTFLSKMQEWPLTASKLVYLQITSHEIALSHARCAYEDLRSRSGSELAHNVADGMHALSSFTSMESWVLKFASVLIWALGAGAPCAGCSNYAAAKIF